ncbi:MAG: polymer-forming cytoskeletal protein [Candidatus Thermoplasmatota archaeon]|nr:polymer-forming cytoskeletal protein [Candidatus Thermoplasmatota archaeon]
MVFDRSLCFIPAGTLLEEKNIRSKGDVIISDRSLIRRGVITEGRVFIGEFAELKGDIVSIGDVRLDKGTRLKGNVTSDADIFIGERCIVQGTLNVGKDLDIGEGASLDPEGIESRGFINIRNPISMMIYLLLYLLQMIKEEGSEEIDRFLSELDGEAGGSFLVERGFLYFPRSSSIDPDTIHIPGDMRIGPGCTIVGDLDVEGGVDIDKAVQVFGDITTHGDLYLGEDVVVNGTIKCQGDVTIHHAARIGGDIRGRRVVVTPDTIIEGLMKGEQGVTVLKEGHTALPEREGMEGMVDIVKSIEELEG